MLESLTLGRAMIDLEVAYGSTPELTADMIRSQLELLIHDEVFRSSKRSVHFLKFIVEKTLDGSADQIKERTIGAEVFGRDPSYDTNLDHIVRTAAAELRKRLATYYVDQRHRGELRMWLLPGSYIPKFTLPGQSKQGAEELGNGGGVDLHTNPVAHVTLPPVSLPSTPAPSSTAKSRRRWIGYGLAGLIVIAITAAFGWLHQTNPQDMFWQPVLDTPGPVLIVVGDHPNGPPTLPVMEGGANMATPIPSSDSSQTVPFSDTVTIARVVGELERKNKKVAIRRGGSVSFSDLRQGAVVLIGAFNNEWSLRLIRSLRYSLAMDPAQHLIYIRDAKNPGSRMWSWGTNQPKEPLVGANSPNVEDFALISRIWDSQTGYAVVVIGGLYTYGTETAGEFLNDPNLMQSIVSQSRGHTLQIILGTTVTDGIPGPPRVLATSAE